MEEVSNTITALANAADFLEHQDYLHPFTFLGVRARLAVLVTAATLVVSASSVGLRNVALAFLDWVQSRVK